MNESRLYNVLVNPHVSEKSMMAQSNGQYVFHVRPDATKTEIRAAVEALFKVNVEAVQVTHIAGKRKRFGRLEGKRKNIKKAYVKLKAGQSIQLFSSAAA